MPKQEITVFAVTIPEALKHVFKGLALDSEGTIRVLFAEPNTFIEIETADGIPLTIEAFNIGQGVKIRKMRIQGTPAKKGV